MRTWKIFLLFLILLSLACMETVTVTSSPLATATLPDLKPDAEEVLPAVTSSADLPLEFRTVCALEFLNVRAGSDTSWTVLYQIARGTRVYVLEWRSGWAMVGNDEWVNGDYLCE